MFSVAGNEDVSLVVMAGHAENSLRRQAGRVCVFFLAPSKEEGGGTERLDVKECATMNTRPSCDYSDDQLSVNVESWVNMLRSRFIIDRNCVNWPSYIIDVTHRYVK